MGALPTVTVVDDNRRGWRIINRADFDPAVHTLYDPDALPPVVDMSDMVVDVVADVVAPDTPDDTTPAKGHKGKRHKDDPAD